VVRQSSAKAPFPSSNLGAASIYIDDQADGRSVSFFLCKKTGDGVFHRLQVYLE
jgi:hypothetical protein